MPKYLTPAFLFAALLCGLAIAPARSQPAPASGVHTKATPTDASSAKRKHRAHRHSSAAPAYGSPVYSQWRGADPSYGPGTAQMRAYQRRGECVLDEGYGRFSSCGER